MTNREYLLGALHKLNNKDLSYAICSLFLCDECFLKDTKGCFEEAEKDKEEWMASEYKNDWRH